MLSINIFLQKNGLVWHKYSYNKINNKLKTLITNIQFLKGKKERWNWSILFNIIIILKKYQLGRLLLIPNKIKIKSMSFFHSSSNCCFLITLAGRWFPRHPHNSHQLQWHGQPCTPSVTRYWWWLPADRTWCSWLASPAIVWCHFLPVRFQQRPRIAADAQSWKRHPR